MYEATEDVGFNDGIDGLSVLANRIEFARFIFFTFQHDWHLLKLISCLCIP
jgi:hypothetical protein